MPELKDGLPPANVLPKERIKADPFYESFFFAEFEELESKFRSGGLNSENLHLRRIERDDLELYRKLAVQSFAETFAFTTPKKDFAAYVNEAYGLDKLSEELNDENSLHYAYFFAGKVPPAYIKINFKSAQTEAMPDNFMEIQRFYCLRTARGLGLGKGLINLAKEHAEREKIAAIWLGVWEYNFKAQAFYKSQGFVHHSEHRFVMGEDEQIDYIYKLNLR